ncbi:hypothetical protein Drose_04145 [Dactylosporangium roseum]|uniref:Uncharacterized protein n=1 Tax=Dactylosporangium roseum TaxID=47989 RepID=A0ABY5Z5Z9_9ACTN|nr:hypothetical protein [Dactylosporangium roseum]UWZ37480.1 hypothetical protein Drose_04145 [Dactylosporangium roseum]
MDWFVVRHPETGGVGVVAETALDHYRRTGWLRVSDALGRDERDLIDLASYADAPDLDAPKAPAKTAKEK